MYKLISLIIGVLLFQQSAYNQVEITDIDPQIGDYFVLEGYETTPIEAGSAGANVTWDFSAIGLSDNVLAYNVVLPDGLSGEENFPLSTKAWTATINGINELNLFMDSEDDDLIEYGSYIVSSESNTLIHYTDPRIRYTSPLNFEDTGSDDVAGSLSIGGMELSSFTGAIDYEVDGYGSLILPTGSYDNAIRIMTVLEEIHEFSIGDIIQTTLVTGYSYFVEDFPVPVVIIEYTESYMDDILIDEFSSMTRLVSYNSVPVNIQDLEVKKNVSIYPNPSSDFITLDFDYQGMATLQILNMDGRIVQQEQIENKGKVDIRDLPAGFYIIDITINGKAYAKDSFIISR